MRHLSIIQQRSSAQFPEYAGDRIYMLPFTQKEGLPAEAIRWQRTVDQMLDGITTDEEIYLMVDESFVRAGYPQRRPGIHIDGYWSPGLSAHAPRGRHAPDPTHGPRRPPDSPSHRPFRHSASRHEDRSWGSASFEYPEAILLASSVQAACGYSGSFEGLIGDMGNCQHIDVSHMEVISFESNVTYAGNVTSLHESLPVSSDCYRQLVRLNVPGWSPQ